VEVQNTFRQSKNYFDKIKLFLLMKIEGHTEVALDFGGYVAFLISVRIPLVVLDKLERQ